ncbi:ABC transporter permease [Aeromicrobium sp. A1-2]|uniref:ABC transporter permease n=1 Tax=Aeromicrobium sp. A1-2 TaxID=2107713 RepID=UPI000E4B8F40|nr:ABC transporter permease [Aeromicrobium sp. A1-2]AXT86524.1 ABC transporter permease [Aeromicrobium sp. A1-2]
MSAPSMSMGMAERPAVNPPSLMRSSATVVWRNLIHIKRMPEMLLDVTIQPVMFVLLFAFVFGGAISVPGGGNYREFLLPGIIVQTIVFSSAITAMGISNDLSKGIVDRFKSLPISRSSVLVGRSISSLIHSSIGITVMSLTGLLIGWRIRDGLVDGVLAYLLLLLFGFSMIWLGIWIGSLMRTVEAVQGFMFTVMFPLTFVANTFAPTGKMPTALRVVAEWNPVSALTQATRELWGNAPAAADSAAWPLQHAVAVSIVWPIILTAIFAPLALRAFKGRSQD